MAKTEISKNKLPRSLLFFCSKNFKDKPKSLDEVDPKLIETYNKLGIPLNEQKKLSGVAVDAVFDSVSVATTFKDELTKKGIIFVQYRRQFKNIKTS